MRPGDWNPKVDAEDVLCVCQSCGAELHADSIGDECPRCGTPSDEAFPHPTEVVIRFATEAEGLWWLHGGDEQGTLQ